MTGGCCHNYPAQTQALQEGLSPHAKIDWTVIHEGGNGTRGKIALYDKEDWAKQFDVVVHNECFADTKDEPHVQRITQAHQAGVPAVVIHCAMHTYRAAPFDDWRHSGVTSRRHDHRSIPGSSGGPESSYHEGISRLTSRTNSHRGKTLANGSEADGFDRQRDEKAHPVMWVNTFGKAKVFGTTYGHNDGTFRDPAFLLAVGRGLLWACDRLEEEE